MMKLTELEVEHEIRDAINEMNDYESEWESAKRRKSPLADNYYKAFLKAGMRLNKLRQHRSRLEAKRYGYASTQ